MMDNMQYHLFHNQKPCFEDEQFAKMKTSNQKWTYLRLKRF